MTRTTRYSRYFDQLSIAMPLSSCPLVFQRKVKGVGTNSQGGARRDAEHCLACSRPDLLHVFSNCYQGGEMLEDGRALPELTFWQIDVHLEGFGINIGSITCILGETIRPYIGCGRPHHHVCAVQSLHARRFKTTVSLVS